MSIWHLRSLVCDSVACEERVDSVRLSADEMRQASKLDGWHRSGGKDYCPGCWERRQAKKKGER